MKLEANERKFETMLRTEKEKFEEMQKEFNLGKMEVYMHYFCY